MKQQKAKKKDTVKNEDNLKKGGIQDLWDCVDAIDYA